MPRIKMRKGRAIIVGIVLVYIIYATATGGVYISNIHDFGGQRNVALSSNIKSDLWLAPKRTGWGLPFVFHYSGSTGPYSLRIQLWDTAKQYDLMIINEIIVDYSDGSRVVIDKSWTRRLEAYTQHNSSSGRVVKTEMMMLSDRIDDIVDNHKDLEMTLIGKLVKVDGTEDVFSVTEDFTANERFDITTFWKVLAGI